MNAALQIVTTTDSRERAEALARHLVDERVAACVQVVGPVRSFYRWEGAVQADEEWQCVVKTHAEGFARVEAAIRQVHTYDVPEILATPVVAGGQDYLDWLREQTA